MAKLPDPELVATGRIRVPVEQLVALVHSVNPTDKGLNAKEKANRYVLKSRLQSLLIREHQESFEVVATGEGVVSLRHRIDGHDACHAVITELEDDARRWVETELALRSATRRPSPRPVAAPTRTDALTRGRAALDEYDYDTARSEFESALPAPAAARALLDLFVNHLAQDADALALATRFADLAAEPELALAAARTGDPRAEGWARASKSAEAFALLAETALRSDVARAARLLDALKDADAAHPAVARISAALADRRREARGPMEAALDSIADPTAKEAAARDLLRRWPESVPARAALREVEEGRRRASTGSLVDAARQAAERHDYDAVIGIAERARRDAAEFDERLEALEARARAVTRALRIHRALTALAQDDFEPWFALPQAERELARRDATHPLLPVVERIPAGNTRAGAGNALARAHADPAAAPELLRPYERLLHGIPEAWRLVDAELARRAALAMDERLGKLERAEAALAAGDLAAAEKLAADAKTPGERERVAALRRKVAATREAARRAEQLRKLREAGDLVGALELARGDGDSALIGELDAAVREAWQIEAFSDAPHPSEDAGFPHPALAPLVALTPAGELILPRAYLHEVFVSRCRPGETEPYVTFALRVPEHFHIISWHVDAATVWMVSRRGAVLRIDHADGRVVRWLPGPPLGKEGRWAEYTCVAHDGRHVWMVICDPDADHQLRVYDSAAWPQFRTIEPWGHPFPLLGPRSPGVGVTHKHTGPMTFSAAGTRLHPLSVIGLMPASRVALSATGEKMVGLGNGAIALRSPEILDAGAEATDPPSPEGPSLFRFTAGIANRMFSAALLSGARFKHPHHTAVSRSTGLQYARVETDVGAEIVAMAENDVAFSRRVPRYCVLVTDETAGNVRAICLRTTGLAEIPLEPSAAPPDENDTEGLDDAPELQARFVVAAVSGIEASYECKVAHAVMTDAALAIGALLHGAPEEEGRARLRAGMNTHRDDPDTLQDLAAAAWGSGARDILHAIEDDMRLRHAGNPRWRVREASELHGKREWDSLAAAVDGIDAAVLPGAIGQHLWHLRAILALRAGDLASCGTHLERAREVPDGGCKLDPIERFLAIRLGRAGSGPLESIVAAIAEADRCFAQGDPAGAFACCSIRPVWNANEVQSAARLAAAALALGPGNGTERLRYRLARAAYAEMWSTREHFVVTNLPVEGAWEDARLEELAVNAATTS